MAKAKVIKQTPQEILEDLQINDEIEEEIDDDLREENLDEDTELQQELQDIEPGAIPQPEDNNNLLKFLKEEVLGSPDRFKTGFLTWEELGKPTFSTRFWLNLSNTCANLFEFHQVAEYCKSKAAITSDTSLSRDGFIISTTVTQRKLKEKRSSSELASFLKDKK